MKVHCFDTNGQDNAITIFNKPLAIDFDPVEFPSKTPTGGKKLIRFCETRAMGKYVEVWDFAGAVKPRLIDAQDGKCTIVVVNKL